MSRKELVLLASRVFASLLFTWVFVEISYLPERCFALFHHVHQQSVLATYDYLSSYYLVLTVFNIVRIVALSWAAVWFWRCGPVVQRLLVHETTREEQSS
jgi:hypothetical protein